MREFLLFLVLVPLLVFSAEPPPNLIDYNGRLTDNAGNPLPTGLVEVEFRLWNQLTGGIVIWAERQYLSIVDGNFSTRLGEGEAITNAGVDIGFVNQRNPGLAGAFLGTQRYLGITVKGGPSPAELSPRTAFASIPYALLAQTTNSLDQAAGTQSRIRVANIAYSTQSFSDSRTLALDKHTNLFDASGGPINATLPAGGANQKLIVTKTDASINMVHVLPGGGKINNSTKKISLKVRGESVTLQNANGDNWWIIADSRDLTPVGTIISYSGTAIPPGFLACNGTSQARSTYTELSDYLASAWGGNLTHFNLPSLQGQFLRGAGNGVNDPDAAKRSPSAAGGNQGAKVGTLQGDMLASHTHPYSLPAHSHDWNSGGGFGLMIKSNVGSSSTTAGVDDEGANEIDVFNPPSRFSLLESPEATGNTSSQGESETRPVNAAVSFIIKY